MGEIMGMLVNFNDIICGGADVLRILRFVFILLDMVCWVVPMGLIVMLMIDFGKNVIAGKEDEMKKNLNIAIKRIIYCIVLFLVPTISNFAISLVSNIGVEAAKCIEIAKDHTDDLSRYEIDYDTFEPAGNTNNNEEQDGNVEEVNKCYQCTDGSGFVLSQNFPNKGFSYATGESFNTTKTFCGPGFEETSMDNCK